MPINAARRTVNKHVVERMISRPSRHSDRTTADWLAIDNVNPPDQDILYDRLVAAGAHLEHFGEIVKGSCFSIPKRCRRKRPKVD